MPQKRNFIAVDGEGVEDKYVMMAASTGQYIMNADGLSTRACFNFLLNLKRPPRATNSGG